MKDTFWTPELWCEFLNSFPVSEPMLQMKMEQFKSSKAPKKEWGIVAYHFKPLLATDKVVLVRPDSEHWKEAVAGNEAYGIHAVVRNSDNEIFSVGDRITGGIIQRIDTTASSMDGIMFRTANVSKPISCAEKLPVPLFVTTDGVDIYPGQEFFQAVDPTDIRRYNAKESDRNGWGELQTFSTLEAAKNYNIENAPCLSLNDVKEACEHLRSNSFEIVIKNATALVKQRLNP